MEPNRDEARHQSQILKALRCQASIWNEHIKYLFADVAANKRRQEFRKMHEKIDAVIALQLSKRNG